MATEHVIFVVFLCIINIVVPTSRTYGIRTLVRDKDAICFWFIVTHTKLVILPVIRETPHDIMCREKCDMSSSGG